MADRKPELILTNARIVTRDHVVEGTVCVRDGHVAAVDHGASSHPGAEDLEGDLLLPGLIELHTDNLEKHFVPRPNVLWPSALAALMAHDAQIVAAGITTVLDAVCVGEYREADKRRFILDQSVRTIRQARAGNLLRADHRLHLRCEVADANMLALFEPYADEPLVRLVSVMDHTPGQRQWSNLAKYQEHNQGTQWTEAQLAEEVAWCRDMQSRHAARHRQAVVSHCRSRGIALASHDDTTQEHIAEAVADGIAISEFPTTRIAALDARRHGLSVVMGAPNVVRGGSHAGNVSAGTLAAEGLLDALSSDYVPASLLHAAFLLHRRLDLTLPAAIATVSANVADMLGFGDRGRIETGRRADLIRVRPTDDFPLVRAVWSEGRRIL